MHQDSPQFQYVNGQMRPHFDALLARYEERNVQARALAGWTWDLSYGPHAREVLDLRLADSHPLGTLVYFHAGYWQSRDKSQFHFLAPAFNALGWDTALVNYPLCPEVGVPRIVDAAARALRQLHRHNLAQGRSAPVVLCGHSAGAHLAIELALQQSTAADPVPLAAVVAISGIYDLRPLVDTSLNARLQLDVTTAQACSPVLRARAGAAPALFLVGETETEAFHTQSQAMARQWQALGNTSAWTRVAAADHFSVLDDLAAADGPMARQLRAWTTR